MAKINATRRLCGCWCCYWCWCWCCRWLRSGNKQSQEHALFCEHISMQMLAANQREMKEATTTATIATAKAKATATATATAIGNCVLHNHWEQNEQASQLSAYTCRTREHDIKWQTKSNYMRPQLRLQQLSPRRSLEETFS